MVNNKYFVTDAHCHIYPEKIALAAVNGTDNFYGLHSVYSGTPSGLVKDGTDCGIDRFIVQSVATTPHQVSSINRFISKEQSESGGRFFGLGTLHPESENIERDIDELIALGLHGVKLHPDIQRFESDDSRMMEIYRFCEKKSLPVLIHTGDYRYDYSNPNRIIPILERYPNLTVIGAHFGGWSVWEEACKMLSGFDNFFVDTSSSAYALTPERVLRLIDSYGIDNVVFGTDYPMWDIKTEIEYILSLNLSETENRKILSENAERIYKIG